MAPRVGLFVTCLVDLMRPSVGFAVSRPETLMNDAFSLPALTTVTVSARLKLLVAASRLIKSWFDDDVGPGVMTTFIL